MDNGNVTKEATCDEDGEKVFTCLNGCGKTETEVIPATGHDYKDVVIKNATCVEDGVIRYTCSKCGDAYQETFKGDHICYSEPQKVEPTCDKDGKEGDFCSICHQFVGDVKVLPATGHSFKNGKCTECGKSDGNVKPATPKLVEKMQSMVGSADYKAASPLMKKVLINVVNEDLSHLLPKISAETLLIWGTLDTATPIKDAEMMESLIPDAGLCTLSGAGHFSYLDRPGDFGVIANKFLEKDVEK
jgi:hypothetical protein